MIPIIKIIVIMIKSTVVRMRSGVMRNMKEKIVDLVKPLTESQKHIQDQFDTAVTQELKDLRNRFALLEQHVYGGDGPERRFEVLEKKQEALGVR